MRKNIILSLILLIFIDWNSQAQDPVKLNLMNGKILEVYQLNDTAYTELRYTFDKNYFKREEAVEFNEKLSDKLNKKRDQDAEFLEVEMKSILERKRKELPPVNLIPGEMDKESVFSAEIPGEGEKLYYYYNEDDGNYLPVDHMKMFINGERDARNNHRGSIAFWSGLAVGAGSGYLMETSIFTLAVPFAFALTTRIPTVKINESHISDPSFKFDENYAAGYESYARSRNTIQGLKGSALGILAGMLIYSLVNPDEVNF